jgi:hypothetical protein
VNTHVDFQLTRCTKSFITNIALVRPLFRVNTHVDFQIIRSTKALLAHITFVRFLFRVSTHVSGQVGWISKHLLANIALLPSLSLRSFPNSYLFFVFFLFVLFFFFFFFLYLMMIRLVEIIILVRNPQTRHQRFFFSRHLQNRPRVHRSFRMWILSSAHVVDVPRVSRREEVLSKRIFVYLRGEKKLRRFSGTKKKSFVFVCLTKNFCFATIKFYRIFPSLEFSLIQNLLTSLSKLSLSRLKKSIKWSVSPAFPPPPLRVFRVVRPNKVLLCAVLHRGRKRWGKFSSKNGDVFHLRYPFRRRR